MTPAERVHRAASAGFGRGAVAYQRARPGYPDPVYERLVRHHGLGPGAEVLDLAAGTGKFTGGLVARGASVLAVEPVRAMAAELTAVLPGVAVVDGVAEDLPLADGSVDLVTVAQAFHWFDAPTALGEIHRVLRPGGALAMVWNVRDETLDWVRTIGDIGERAGGGRPYDRHTSTDWEGLVASAGGWGPVREDWFPNWQSVDAGVVVDRVASTSWISALPDPERAAVLDEVRAVLRTHPATRDRDTFPFPHATVLVTVPRS